MSNSLQSFSEDTSYHYWAFISYSHQDNLLTRGDGCGDHIQWANWLHEQLETFRIPDGYRDRPARTGEPMPERFFPAFRDEAELPTSHDLGGQIRDALARSRFLIVIASPRSAGSRYVNEEVRYFHQIGRGNRILVLIVDGEPNVRLHPKAGWTAGDDCFCPALVHPLRSDGEVDTTRVLPEEPIAADVRVKDIEPPREMRASEHSQPDRRSLLDFMKLKLIAGLMGVGLDELAQRDKRRVEEELRRVRREVILFCLKSNRPRYCGSARIWISADRKLVAQIRLLDSYLGNKALESLGATAWQIIRSAWGDDDRGRGSKDRLVRLWPASTDEEAIADDISATHTLLYPDMRKLDEPLPTETHRLWPIEGSSLWYEVTNNPLPEVEIRCLTCGHEMEFNPKEGQRPPSECPACSARQY